jgi:hypothetical protein
MIALLYHTSLSLAFAKYDIFPVQAEHAFKTGYRLGGKEAGRAGRV